jgi:hypothetical protein
VRTEIQRAGIQREIAAISTRPVVAIIQKRSWPNRSGNQQHPNAASGALTIGKQDLRHEHRSVARAVEAECEASPQTDKACILEIT